MVHLYAAVGEHALKIWIADSKCRYQRTVHRIIWDGENPVLGTNHSLSKRSAKSVRRPIIGDKCHERAVRRRLQPPHSRHGSSKLRSFGKELEG
jgi:hypothetical protein